MRINTNTASLVARENATATNKALTSSLEKLSSGLAINKASDNASGLAIADKLRTQASSIGQSIQNGNSAVTLTQIADKAMAEQSNILDTVKQKLIQAATATTSSEGRNAIAKDIDKLLGQVNNIASQTNYNGLYLLQKNATTSTATSAVTFQMGEYKTDTIKTSGSVRANVKGLGISALKNKVSSETKVTTGAAGTQFSASFARSMMKTVDTALTKLNGWRADFGSTQNQLESAVTNMMTQQTNILSAESVIRDVDYAEESSNFTQKNIISQAGTYALSQANSISQNVMSLLQ